MPLSDHLIKCNSVLENQTGDFASRSSQSITLNENFNRRCSTYLTPSLHRSSCAAGTASAYHCHHFLKAFVKPGTDRVLSQIPVQSEVMSNFPTSRGLQTKSKNAKADRYRGGSSSWISFKSFQGLSGWSKNKVRQEQRRNGRVASKSSASALCIWPTADVRCAELASK